MQSSGEAEAALDHRGEAGLARSCWVRQGLPSDIERGGASPRGLGETKPPLGGRARRSQSSAIRQGGARPRGSGMAELALSRRVRRS